MAIFYGHPDIKKFIDELEMPARTKTTRYLELLERDGRALGMPFSKHVVGDILELRMAGIQNVRILYAFDGEDIALLLGILKKTQKLAARDIETAKKRFERLRAS